MALWLILFFSSLLLLIFLTRRRKKNIHLPPSPPTLPIFGNLLWLIPNFNLGPTLSRLHSLLGPIVTLHIPFCPPCIFIMDPKLAHASLIRNAASFSDRPPPLGSGRAFRIHAHNINNAPYGLRWQSLRHTLGVNLLSPSRVDSYIHTQQWALAALVDELESRAKVSQGVVVVRESFSFAIYRAMALICFGDKLGEGVMFESRSLQCEFLALSVRLSVYSLLPSIAMVLFLSRRRKALDISKRLDELLLPIFRARQHVANPSFVSYIDLLRSHKLTDDEMVSHCMEFLNAGVETTSAMLEWIMANLVKNQEMQEHLYKEVNNGNDDREHDHYTRRMPYLKAVVLEGLRRHPAGHVSLPHMVTETVELDRYVIPEGAVVNYALAEINWDESVWEKPMEFQPERFLGRRRDGENVDSYATLAGVTEIKMMPFGAGRRMCPGARLAMTQLCFFVANLLRRFRWERVDGEEVELEEEPGLITTMKNPLRARIFEREAY